ncbi:hypothetical protein BY996DRAFT_6564463 [Phakopsora pachyrhizi]|nr:hypothetical protein BY996DRAFT_6564463 [Phakopsora pachyrhizi]
MKSNASPQNSFAASKLATESQNLGINIPQYRYDKSFDLNSADIREGSLQLERQVSSAGASAISKFDLNEFPADMGSPTSHNRIEKIDEAKYNLDFKRKTPEAVDASLIRQENVKPPCQTIEIPGVKIYNAGAKQKTLAADQQSKIGRHIALQSKENPSKDTLDTIKNLIWVEKKKSGPFDIEPKMTNC